MILKQWKTVCCNITKHICLPSVKDRGSSHSVQLLQRLFTRVSKWPRYGLIVEKQIDSQGCECKLHGNRRWLCHFNSEGHTFHFIELGRVTRASLRHWCPAYYIMSWGLVEQNLYGHRMLCRDSVLTVFNADILMLFMLYRSFKKYGNGQVVTLV